MNLGYFSSNFLNCGDEIKEKIVMDKKRSNQLKVYFEDNFMKISLKNPFCPNCGRNNIKRNGFRKRKLIFPETGVEIVKIQKYTCLNKCNDEKNKYFVTNIDSIVYPNSNYTKRYINKSKDLYKVGTVSLRNSAELMNIDANTSVSHQSIENWIIKSKDNELRKPEKFSGYYVFDIQWTRNYRKWKYRYSIADAIFNTLVADDIFDNEDSNTIKKFLNENLFNKPKVAMTTDLDKKYKPIIEKMGLKHQWCMYHARKVLKNRVKEYTKENKTLKYEDDLMYYYVDKIMMLYECKSLDQAKDSLNWLKREFNYLPDCIKIMINELIMPYFKTFTLFLTDPNVSRTSNLCENIFNKTNPKYITTM